MSVRREGVNVARFHIDGKGANPLNSVNQKETAMVIAQFAESAANSPGIR